MKAEFRIDVEVPRDFVRITMRGFFDSRDIGRFTDARDRAHRLLRCGPNDHVTLVDMRGMDIQTQDIVAAFQQVLSDTSRASRRLAFVVSRSLARLQIKRAAGGRDARYFATVDEAEAWLLADGHAPSS